MSLRLTNCVILANTKIGNRVRITKTKKMEKKEVLKHLDELVKPMMTSSMLWTRDEAIAMQVQTFRTYRLVAQHNGIHESTVKRMCERVINQNKLLSL